MNEITWDHIINTAPDIIRNILEGLKDHKENPEYHPEENAYNHIKIVTERLIKTGDMDLIMAGFFHDLGKLGTAQKSEDGDWNSSHGHENVSSQLVLRYKDWIEEMGANPYVVNEIVKNHMKIKFNAISKKDKDRLERYTIFQKLNDFANADNMKRKWDLDEGLNLFKKPFPDRYFDYNTNKEFPYDEIDQHRAWYKKQYDQQENVVYREAYDNYWNRMKYDQHGNIIHFEDSNGFSYIKEYDTQGNQIYYEDSSGNIYDQRNEQLDEGLNLVKKKFTYFDFVTNVEFDIKDIKDHPEWYKLEYDQNENIVYREEFNGYWAKYDYDEWGNDIYFENSNGLWYRAEFDANGAELYYKDSRGNVVDYRNEQLDEGLNLFKKPFPDRYFDLDTFKEFSYYEIDRHPRWYKEEYDDAGNETYYEDSDGYWSKSEYDEWGNDIYRESNDGGWEKWEYDKDGKHCIYNETSYGGVVFDKRNGQLDEGLNLFKTSGDIKFDRITVHYNILEPVETSDHEIINNPVELTYKIDDKDFPELADTDFNDAIAVLHSEWEEIRKYIEDDLGYYLWSY